MMSTTLRRFNARTAAESDAVPETFEEQWRPRRITGGLGEDWPFAGDQPPSLEDAVRRAATRLESGLGSGLRVAIGVAVERRDGMTWSRLASQRAIGAGWTVRTTEPGGPLAELTGLTGSERAIRTAARTSGLAPRLRRYWIWLLSAAVVLAASTAVLTAVAKNAGAVSPTVVGLSVLAAAVAVVHQLLVPHIAPVFGAAAREELDRALAEGAIHEAKAEADFRDAIREQLVPERGKRQAVVIDNLGDLSQRTRDIVRDYIERPARRGGEELWILFERGQRPRQGSRGRRGEPLSAPNLATMRRGDGVYLYRCRQKPLDAKDKETLLLKLERRRPARTDPRFRLRGVADVTQSTRDSGRVADAAELEEHLRHLEPARTRAFALFAVAATVPMPAPIPAGDLARIARSAPGSPAAELLQGWFPEDSAWPDAIDGAARSVAEELAPLFEEPPQRPRFRIRVATPYADAMLDKDFWTRLGSTLPSPDLAHAFWALYWRDRLNRGWSAATADRMIEHLRALREPGQIRERSGQEVVTALFDAALEGIEAALALTLAGIARGTSAEPALPEQAYLLLGAIRDDAAREVRRSRLINALWTAYALTGESELFEPLAGLGHEPVDTPYDVVAEVYLGTIPRGIGGRSQWSTLATAADPPFGDYVRARGAWLAEILHPLAHRSESQWLLDAAHAGRELQAMIAGRAATRMSEGATTSAVAVDCMTLLFVLLSDLLAVYRDADYHVGVRGERLDEARAVARSRLQTSARLRGSTNFILETLLRQVDVTCRAIPVLVAHNQEKGSSSAVRNTLIALDQVHVVWQNLELEELADLAALVRNIAGALARRTSAAADGERFAPDYLLGLSDRADRPVYRLEAQLTAGSVRLKENADKAGLPLQEAGCLAVERDLGRTLTYEICRAVTADVANPNPSTEILLRQLLAPPPGVKGVLDVPDEQTPSAARDLLRCLKNSDSELADRVRGAIAERKRTIESRWLADYVDQEVEWFEAFHAEPMPPWELRTLRARWDVRIWGGRPPGASAVDGPQPHGWDAHCRWLYGWVLSYRRSEWADMPAMVEDAARLIRGIDLTSVDVGAVRLAHHLWDELDRQATDDVALLERALEIQRRGIADAELWFAPQANHSIYSRLARIESNGNTAFRERAEYWRVEAARLREERVLHLAATGRYFELFWHYCESYPELPRVEADGQRSPSLADANGRGAVPPALVYDADGLPAAVSASFLKLGDTLFHGAPQAADQQWDDTRAAIDYRAREEVPGLYWLLIEKTAVSDALRDIFRRQRDRFEELDNPNSEAA